MSTVRYEQDRIIREAFAPARGLEPTEAELMAVLRGLPRASAAPRTSSRRRHRFAPRARRALPVALAAFALAGAGYAAAPPFRDAIDSVAGTFSGWVGGNPSAAPGRPLRRGDDAPAYLRDPRYEHQPRVIAHAGRYGLYVSRERSGMLNFDLGNTGFGESMLVGTRFFERHSLYVLGPGAMQHADSQNHVPLFGITSRSVRSVELTYYHGPPLIERKIEGGFVLLARPDLKPHEVLALDASGGIVGRQLVDNSHHWGPQIDWSRYER
jgi:hypothetical protein